MPPSATTHAGLYDRYLTDLDTAVSMVEVMRNLPDEHRPVKELADALDRVIAAVRKLDLPLGSACEILQVIADGGQS
jgi:hypothetical protein